MILKILGGCKHSLEGLVGAYRADVSFRFEVWTFAPLTLFIMCQDITSLKKLLLLASMILVLSAELFNTALEKTIDGLGEGKIHPLLKLAKDTSSAAVFLLILLGGLIWSIVLCE